jgi:DNA-binding transcriptional LysR family regulator
MLLRPIRYLKAVADHGSFTRAASALHVSQPALSQQIREFEERMGVQMLDRSGRQVRPTDAGEVYLRHVRRALDELEVGGRAIRDVQDLSSGALRLGFTPSFAIYLLAPLIRRYRDRFPGIVLTVTEMAQEEMERAVSADALDVGLAFTDVLAQDVEWLPLHKERLSLIVGQEHPAATGDREMDTTARPAWSHLRNTSHGGSLSPPARRSAPCGGGDQFDRRHRGDRPCRRVSDNLARDCGAGTGGPERCPPDACDRFPPRSVAPTARRLS